jgi:hypothetical protein
MLHTLAVSSYRSLRDFIAPLGQLTLITGPNGSGKSNVYRASPMVGPFGLPALARHRRVRRASPTATLRLLPSLRPCRYIRVSAFDRFDEILDLVEKTSDLTLSDLGPRVLRSVATSLSQSVGNSGLANDDAVASKWRAPIVERCLFSGPCETGSFARSLQGWIYGDPENKYDPRSACLSIELDKQLSETQILGQGNLDVPSWHWLNR